MANDQDRGSPEDLGGQDPFVERRRPDPSQPPEDVRILEGLLGHSDREGNKRLYFTRELERYAEFRQEDVLFSEPIPPEQPPLVGLDATRVGIRREATVEYTRVRTPKPVDEFDLDIRLGALEGRAAFVLRGDCTDTAFETAGEWACDPCDPGTPGCPVGPHIPMPQTRNTCPTCWCTPAGVTPCCPGPTEGAGASCDVRCWTRHARCRTHGGDFCDFTEACTGTC